MLDELEVEEVEDVELPSVQQIGSHAPSKHPLPPGVQSGVQPLPELLLVEEVELELVELLELLLELDGAGPRGL